MSKVFLADICDAELKKAVKNILFFNGMELVDSCDGENPVITDKREAQKGKRLYLGRDVKSGEKHALMRPFTENELILALKLLCASEEKNEKRGELRLEKRKCTAYYEGRRIPLTETENALLSMLLANRGKTVTDEEILSEVFGGQCAENSNICAVYINYLRKKLEQDSSKRLIFRVRGSGYMIK